MTVSTNISWMANSFIAQVAPQVGKWFHHHMWMKMCIRLFLAYFNNMLPHGVKEAVVVHEQLLDLISRNLCKSEKVPQSRFTKHFAHRKRSTGKQTN